MSQQLVDNAKLAASSWAQMVVDGSVKSFKLEIVDGKVSITFVPIAPVEQIAIREPKARFPVSSKSRGY